MEMRGMSGELLGHIGPPGIPVPDIHPASGKPTHPDVTTNSHTAPSSPVALPPALSTTTSTISPTKAPIQSPSPSPAFLSKKRKILASLHGTAESATDKSPKGGVDSQIRELIDEINGYDGLVTTSSCAGRMSVFLEGGRKGAETGMNGEGGEEGEEEEGEEGEDAEEERESAPAISDGTTATRNEHSKDKAKASSKGLGGKWLFVSHEPLDSSSITHPTTTTTTSSSPTSEQRTWTSLFGLLPSSSSLNPLTSSPASLSSSSRKQPPAPPRLITLSFEPLILHIHCASLRHASRVLIAAQAAGFRESGMPSLRIGQDDGMGVVESGGVAVAVRSVGLGVRSIVGVWAEDDNEGDDGVGGGEKGKCRAIVDEAYLELLVKVVGERFRVNEERRGRFARELRRVMEDSCHGEENGDEGESAGGWEDRDVRARRKRAEGLRRRDEMEREREKGVDGEGMAENLNIQLYEGAAGEDEEEAGGRGGLHHFFPG